MRWSSRCWLAGALLVTLLLGVLGSWGCDRAARDQCSPQRFRLRCGPADGSLVACVHVDASDYVLGLGQPHYEVTTLRCPGFKPRCVQRGDEALCTAK